MNKFQHSLSKYMLHVCLIVLLLLSTGSGNSDSQITKWIESEIFSYIQQRQFTDPNNTIKVQFHSATIPEEKIKKGKVSVNCRKQGFINGKTVFTLSYIDKESENTFQVVADIIRYANVPVLNHHVERHHILSEKDLSVNFVQMNWSSNENAVSLNEAIGKRTKRSIPQGRVLKESMIETVPLVKRGDQVKMKVVNKNIHLTIPVICHDKGSQGDVIKVRDTVNNRYYYAEIQNSTNVIYKSNKR